MSFYCEEKFVFGHSWDCKSSFIASLRDGSLFVVCLLSNTSQVIYNADAYHILLLIS